MPSLPERLEVAPLRQTFALEGASELAKGPLFGSAELRGQGTSTPFPSTQKKGEGTSDREPRPPPTSAQDQGQAGQQKKVGAPSGGLPATDESARSASALANDPPALSSPGPLERPEKPHPQAAPLPSFSPVTPAEKVLSAKPALSSPGSLEHPEKPHPQAAPLPGFSPVTPIDPRHRSTAAEKILPAKPALSSPDAPLPSFSPVAPIDPRHRSAAAEKVLFAPEGSAEGCASGECLSEQPSTTAAERWRAAVEAVKHVSPRHGRSLAFGRVVTLRPGEAVLSFPKDAAFHRATVTGTARPIVEKALSEHFGQPTRILDQTSDAATASAGISLAEEEAKGRAERERGIEAKVRSHPAVRAAMKILGGELEHVQVLERGRPGEGEGEGDPPATG